MALKKELMPVIGREDEIRRMIQILGRKTKNNPVIVGDSGVGKTAVVEGLAQRIVEGNIPEYLKGKRVMALDMGRLVAGTKLRGEFEERMKAVVDEVKKSAGEIILFIDELHTLVGTGSAEGSMDAANLLKPPLARGELRCIGATTLDEYRKRIEKDKALERRFQMVMIEEPSAEDAIDILNGLREVFEKHHGVRITGPAIEAAVKLSDRYITERFLPDKAIDLIDEAASKIKLETTYLPSDLTAMEKQLQTFEEEISEMVSHSEYEQAARKKMEMEKMKETYSQQYEEWKKDLDTKPKVVNEYVIAEIVEKWTGIPTTRMLRSEKEKILNLEAMMHEKIVDQEEAVTAVAQAVRRSKAGLKDPKRPSGSFLFLGPTGVGKTELAKALAEILFGSEEALVRIDMSEYGEKFAVSRLIGSPPGYVGYDEGGQLTEAIRRRPYSVILMDEIDKAHPETYHILLQLMEDGRLTDGKGHVVDFRNTILILTSNIASDEIVKGKRKLGFGDEDDGNEEIKTVVSDELKKFFKPELINRLDNIIVFKTLSQEDMKKIVSILMVHLNERVVDKHIKLNLSEDAQEFLARKGYDPSFGARPLRRMMEKYIEVPLSDLILEEKVKEGDSVQILVDQDQDKLHFEVMVE
jgi:ATP-dependent Clp protease ATP-binding subunit ClpC